jgi:predicted metal-dependent hydrolase
MDYLIVHELAHLREMNHSHRFWSLVASMDPNYWQAENWLKRNGIIVEL